MQASLAIAKWRLPTLSATFLSENVLEKNIVWHSGNQSVADISPSTGQITAKSVGSTLITATTDDGCFAATCFVYVEKAKIYQTANTFVYDKDGKLPEDMKYNDIPVSSLKGNEIINKYGFAEADTEELLYYWEDLCEWTSTEPLQSVALDMVDRFMSGSGGEYSNEILTQKVIEHSSTQNYIESVKNCIYQLLDLYNGDITQLYYVASERDWNPLVQLMVENKIYEPYYDTMSDKLTGLMICIHGLWGNQIEVKSFSKLGKSYSGVLTFTLYDHFGLDAIDVEKYVDYRGFSAWYILQHSKKFNGAYKPFVTKIYFEVPFSGTIS